MVLWVAMPYFGGTIEGSCQMKKYSKRIKTYHGISVPPWRHEPVGRCMTMVFILKGRIPSKKNELVAVVDRADAFAYLKTLPAKVDKKDCVTMLFKTFGRVKNSLEYEKWEANAIEILKEQQKVFIPAAQKHGIIFPIYRASVVTKFYWKGKYRRDNSNKSEGLHDALVKAHILLDDSDRVMPETSQGAKDYSEEVTESMAVMYITVPLPLKKPTD